jgi:hypothetical protein
MRMGSETSKPETKKRKNVQVLTKKINNIFSFRKREKKIWIFSGCAKSSQLISMYISGVYLGSEKRKSDFWWMC